VTDKTRIVILKPEGQDAIGILIDSVKEVITLNEESIEKRKYDAKDEKTKYINGVGKHNESLISLLNVAGVVSEN
jgi:purine-binding chemotaxis protein CheW